MGLTDKEAASLQNISAASFQKAKYRLKKKLEISKNILLTDVVANLQTASTHYNLSIKPNGIFKFSNGCSLIYPMKAIHIIRG